MRCWGLFLSIGFVLQAAKTTPAGPTFNKEVSAILFAHCAGCHRPGEVAPFALLTYQDAAKRASLIASVTAHRFMPPWKPEPGFGEFQDSRRLSDADLATLQAWAKAGAPEGDSPIPQPPKFAEGWQLGEPDLIVKMPEAFTVPAEGNDIYQCFVIPLNLTEDKSVSAVEFRPGNRKVTHHAIFYLDASGAARKKDEADPGPGYRCFGGAGITPSGGLGGWAPGAAPRFLPDGIAKPLRKGSDLVMQAHYHPTGKVESDLSTVGIYFAKSTPMETTGSIPLIKRDLYIPAGDKDLRTVTSFTIPVDVKVIGIFPHMHLLGRDMKVTATLPDGTVRPMIWIKDWDFNWQGEYMYKDPVLLPKGTRLEMDAAYDNSEDNPRNPNHPPKSVKWGEQTTDEMAVAFIEYASERPAEQWTILRALMEQLNLRRSQHP